MKLVKCEDRILIKSYLSGNEHSFEVLLSKHQDRVFAYINKLIKDNDLSNDIFQDTFIKVITTLKRGKYNEEGKFLPWVMRIAHNLVIDYFRKSSKMKIIGRNPSHYDKDFDIFSVLELNDFSVEDEMVIKQIHNDVRILVELLPSEQRDIVKLRHFTGMSFKDIADKKDISINTALGRMRYALINLRKIIEEKGVVLTTV
jgi:RNA polymerase sigma-70 factor (ECF subfamily)